MDFSNVNNCGQSFRPVIFLYIWTFLSMHRKRLQMFTFWKKNLATISALGSLFPKKSKGQNQCTPMRSQIFERDFRINYVKLSASPRLKFPWAWHYRRQVDSGSPPDFARRSRVSRPRVPPPRRPDRRRRTTKPRLAGAANPIRCPSHDKAWKAPAGCFKETKQHYWRKSCFHFLADIIFLAWAARWRYSDRVRCRQDRRGSPAPA